MILAFSETEIYTSCISFWQIPGKVLLVAPLLNQVFVTPYLRSCKFSLFLIIIRLIIIIQIVMTKNKVQIIVLKKKKKEEYRYGLVTCQNCGIDYVSNS